jgi:hypothetical protein
MNSFRSGAAKICLVLSWGISAAGFFMLCECPGFYVSSGVLALVPIFLGEKRLKWWGAAALTLAVTVFSFQIYDLARTKNRAEAVHESIRQRSEAEARAATNSPPPAAAR